MRPRYRPILAYARDKIPLPTSPLHKVPRSLLPLLIRSPFVDQPRGSRLASSSERQISTTLSPTSRTSKIDGMSLPVPVSLTRTASAEDTLPYRFFTKSKLESAIRGPVRAGRQVSPDWPIQTPLHSSRPPRLAGLFRNRRRDPTTISASAPSLPANAERILSRRVLCFANDLVTL